MKRRYMMKRLTTSVGLVLILVVIGSPIVAAQERMTVDVSAAFGPHNSSPETTPIAQQWTTAIGTAQKSIRVTLYSFTLFAFRDALIQAKGNHPDLDIRVVFDQGILNQAGEAENLRLLSCAGIPLKVYVSSSLMHHKFVLIDADDPTLQPTLITGSANKTVAAVRNNHDNQTLLTWVSGSRALFDWFRDEFEAMWANVFDYPAGSSFNDWVAPFC